MTMQSPFADAGRDANSRLAAMGMGSGGAPPAEAGKVPMGDANYQRAPSPEQACGACAHFIDPDMCEIVAGRVAVDGVSDFFEPVQMAGPPQGGQMPAAPPAPPAPAGGAPM